MAARSFLNSLEKKSLIPRFLRILLLGVRRQQILLLYVHHVRRLHYHAIECDSEPAGLLCLLLGAYDALGGDDGLLAGCARLRVEGQQLGVLCGELRPRPAAAGLVLFNL